MQNGDGPSLVFLIIYQMIVCMYENCVIFAGMKPRMKASSQSQIWGSHCFRLQPSIQCASKQTHIYISLSGFSSFAQ